MTKNVVILPGWGGSRESWEPFLAHAAIQNGVRFEVLELPCFGNVPCPDEPWNIPEYANYVKDHLPEKTDAIIGHSFGGQVAAYLFSQEPSIAPKLFLFGAAVARNPHSLKNRFYGHIAKKGQFLMNMPGLSALKEHARVLLYTLTGSKDYMKTSGIQKEIIKNILAFDVLPFAERITTSTVVIAGTDDTYVSHAAQKKVASHIPNATFVSVPSGRHGMHQQEPERLYDIIIDHI